MAVGWAWGHLETQQGDRKARGASLAPKGAEKTEFSWASTSSTAPPASLPGPLGLGIGTLFPRHKWGFIRKVCFLVGGAQNTLSYRNTRLAWFLVWLQKFLKPEDRVPLGATSTGLISESLGPRDLCSQVYSETPVPLLWDSEGREEGRWEEERGDLNCK